MPRPRPADVAGVLAHDEVRTEGGFCLVSTVHGSGLVDLPLQKNDFGGDTGLTPPRPRCPLRDLLVAVCSPSG